MGNKVTKQEWETAIRKARQYTSGYRNARWIIAELAFEVCDTAHGGRKTESIYSVKRFADEIEIDVKTLYQWMRVKRLLLDKLPKMIRNNPNKYNYTDFENVCDQVNAEMNEKEIKDIWVSYHKRPPESRKFEKYLEGLSGILYNAQRPMIMKDVENKYIEKMLEKITLISGLLNKELELREKYKDTKRQNIARVNVKGEFAKRLEATE